jgi:hypothetical protein
VVKHDQSTVATEGQQKAPWSLARSQFKSPRGHQCDHKTPLRSHKERARRRHAWPQYKKIFRCNNSLEDTAGFARLGTPVRTTRMQSRHHGPTSAQLCRRTCMTAHGFHGPPLFVVVIPARSCYKWMQQNAKVQCRPAVQRPTATLAQHSMREGADVREGEPQPP